MRTRTMILTGALLLVSAGLAQAQQTATSTTSATTAQAPSSTPVPTAATVATPKFGRVDFGFRGSSVDGDSARYNRFRDWRDGGYVDQFKYKSQTETTYFSAAANNVGYRDQRYAAEFQDIGRLKAAFEWNQTPLFISNSTKTLFKDNGNGVLTIDDSIQQGIQNGTTTLANVIGQAQGFDLRSRRDTASFDMAYTASRDVDVKFNLRNMTRSGKHLQSFGFGNSPGNMTSLEMGLPEDDRTTDVKAALEWANTKGLLSVGYLGSWYHNAFNGVQFENPLRYSDINAGPSLGEYASWPGNNAFSVNVTGAVNLPARSRATAFISTGRWQNNTSLLASTVNTALVAPPLERASAEAKANITAMTYGFNSRPVTNVSFNAKYRYYDYNNKTPVFDTVMVPGDWSLGANEESEPASIKRHNVDLDASFTPLQYAAFGIGYSREDSDRTFRIFEKTAEDSFRATFDSTGYQYASLRLKYEHSVRKGSGFDEELLADVGEYDGMRHYDVADRNRDRVTAIFTVTPISQFDINASIGTGKDDYKGSTFGLRNNKNSTYSVGFDVVPVDTVSFGLNYGYEKYTALQLSRSASPGTQQLESSRDWSDNSNDQVKTLNASLDLTKALPKTDIRFGYDLSDGKATYVYTLQPNQPIFTTTAMQQLSPLKNKLTSAHADLQYYIRPNVALGGTYWYEQYKVQDFALGESTIDKLNQPFLISSGYLYRPYTAHTGWVHVTYLW